MRTVPELKTSFRDRKGMKYAAVNHTNTGVASTLMALTPVLIIIPYSIIYRCKVTLKEIVGVAVSMAGVAMFFML